MKILLLRHAETDHNLAKIIQGSLDTVLNADGHEQAECVAKRLEHIKPLAIYCSDLRRCKETLQHVIDRMPDRPEVIYTEMLRERYMGELQGMTKEKVRELCEEQRKSRFDFGEGTQALLQRIKYFWEEKVLPIYSRNASDQHAGSEGDNEDVILICSHGGTLLQMTHALVDTYGFTLAHNQGPICASPNTAVTILDTDRMMIERLADISHLDNLSLAEKDETAKLEVVDA